MTKYKSLRAKILDKYDKNNDGFITIDEFMAEEISKGPKADVGVINYHYQNIDNIFYFIYILKQLKKYKIVCIPNYTIYYERYSFRTCVIFDVDNNDYYITDSVKDGFSMCETIPDIRFIYFTLVLFSRKKISHVNMVITDLKKKTIERFEPHGRHCYCYDNDYDRLTKQIDNFFNNKLLSYLNLSDFKYMNPIKYIPRFGVQCAADAYGGMCVTIITMYFHMRILNPDKDQKKIINYFLKMDKVKLKEKILKYAKYMEKKLKDNPMLVNSLFT